MYPSCSPTDGSSLSDLLYLSAYLPLQPPCWSVVWIWLLWTHVGCGHSLSASKQLANHQSPLWSHICSRKYPLKMSAVLSTTWSAAFHQPLIAVQFLSLWPYSGYSPTYSSKLRRSHPPSALPHRTHPANPPFSLRFHTHYPAYGVSLQLVHPSLISWQYIRLHLVVISLLRSTWPPSRTSVSEEPSPHVSIMGAYVGAKCSSS